MRSAPLSAIVLAAGDGTRMRSNRPKPLHVLCGKAMLLYVIDALSECKLERLVVVVGSRAERVSKKVQQERTAHYVEYVEQLRPLGTGDAVMSALSAFAADDDIEDADVLVLPGDTPLLRPETIAGLAEEHDRSHAAVTVLTAMLADAPGQPRVRRDKNGRLVELIDGDDADFPPGTAEVSTGIYCFRRGLLAPALRRVQPRTRSGEYYLSDVVAVLAETGHTVSTHQVGDTNEILGVNDRVQLAAAEFELRRRTNHEWLRRGVTMIDPGHTYVDTTVNIGADVTLFPGVMLQGRTLIGEGSEIGPHCRIVDSVIGKRCRVEHSTLREAEVADDAQVGPFAFLPRGSAIGSGQVTGPFYTAQAE